MTIGTDLASGRLTAGEAADWFERSHRPWATFSRLMKVAADDKHASGLLAAAVVLTRPELITDDNATDSDVDEVFDETAAFVLEQYKTWKTVPSLTVAVYEIDQLDDVPVDSDGDPG